MNDDIISIGFRRGIDIHLACTDIGLSQLPEPIRKSKYKHPGSNMWDIWLAATIPNVVALLMMGLITNNEAMKITEGKR